MPLKIGQLLKKYTIVILLPTLVASAIYADYSHTQIWKKQQKQLELIGLQKS